MRVIEPRHHHVKQKRRSTRRSLAIVGVVVGAGLILLGLRFLADNHSFSLMERKAAVGTIEELPAQVPVNKGDKPKFFTGNQFRDLYRSILPTYPNTEEFAVPPVISGNEAADQRIRGFAEQRGFRLTRIPVTALVKTNEPKLLGETDDLLQPQAFKGWLSLKADAQKSDIPLTLLSAYRSPEWQRDIFMDRLGLSSDAIAAGYSDDAVKHNLTVTAVPGYSRHHTGYAVDFWCEDGAGNFASSVCAKWLIKNNYLNAKTHGWIPSYPEGADEQGPEPEPWEYVWVGRTLLFE